MLQLFCRYCLSLASALALMYFYISTFRSMCAVPNMAVFCSSLLLLLLLFSLALQPSAGYDLLVTRGFLITQNEATQLVGLLWTSDQPVEETSTCQHKTHPTNTHPCRRWDSNP
jgi:hypothetical protein